VTLCDGVNDRIAQRSDADLRSLVRFDDVDAELRGTIDRLLDASGSPVSLRPIRAEVRGHAVMVALEPSGAQLAELRERRHELLAELEQRCGVRLDTPWRPHVTLAYTADQPTARSLDAQLRSTDVAELVPLVASSASVYRFGSMIDFRPLASWPR
jgi:hypothetical protein